MTSRKHSWLAMTFWVWTIACPGQTPVLRGPPEVNALNPRAGTVGSEVTLTFRGTNLEAAEGLLLHREGLRVESVGSTDGRSAFARVSIPADCPLGEHVMHLRTAHGLSEPWAFHVGSLPCVAEPPRTDGPRAIPYPVTLDGSLLAGEEDRFALDLPQGRASFEVVAVRLGPVAPDVRMKIFGPDGTLLADVEDTPLGGWDPHYSFFVEHPGPHVVSLVETTGVGSNAYQYLLHVGSFPRPTGVIVDEGPTGPEIPVRFLEASGEVGERLLVPRSQDWLTMFPKDQDGIAPTPLTCFAPEGSSFSEAGLGDQTLPAAPWSVSGCLSRQGEVDRYRFPLEGNQTVRIAAHARRLGSPADLFLVVNDGAKDLQAADDVAGNPDPSLTFRAPKAGIYTLKVRDLLARGSSQHIYRIHLAEGRPPPLETGLVVTRDRRRRRLLLPAGGRMGVVLRTTGPLPGEPLGWTADLPEGVRVADASFTPGSNEIPLVLEAAADAPRTGWLLRPRLRLPNGEADAGFAHDLPRVEVENNRVYGSIPLTGVPTAVCAPLPYSVTVATPTAALIARSGLNLEVRVKRQEGFSDPVTLSLLHAPPGIRAGSVTIPKGQTHGTLPLSQSGALPKGPVQVFVVARTDGRHPTETCSDAVPITVVPAYFAVESPMLRIQPDGAGSWELDIKVLNPLPGPATLEIPNLPANLTVEIPPVPPTGGVMTCRLSAGKSVRPGRYTQLVFRFRIGFPSGGEAVQDVRGGELRVDPARTDSGPVPKALPRGTVAHPKTESP